MKAKKIFLIVGAAVMMTGCGSKQSTSETTPVSAVQTETQTASAEMTPAETTVGENVTEETTAVLKESGETIEITSDDNFSVSTEDAADFADMIKEAVTNKDLEALADLTAYPIYMKSTDGGQSLENKEALVALGTDNVFTEALVDSVNQADGKNLLPSKAGFILTKENGAPNIVFGLRDGKLSVLGINY